MSKFLIIIAVLLISFDAAAQQVKFERQDYFVLSEPNIKIHIRKVSLNNSDRKSAVLLLHGGSGAGVASFDVDVKGYSLAEDLAQAGHTVYLMDARGYGSSTKPAELDDSSLSLKSSVISENVAKDIDAVIKDIQSKQKVKKVAAFGWASGGHWLGFYTAKNNGKISRLILLNSIYGVNAAWGLRAAFENKEKPGVFNEQAGAFRRANVNTLTASWINAIPVEDKNSWRDPQVADFYVKTTLDGESADRKTDPPTVRLPNGFQREAYEMSLGRKIFDAAEIRVPTLVIRSELDHWSRPEDLTALEKDLKNATRKKFVMIPGATHLLFLDRPEHGRNILIKEIIGFLAEV